MRVFLLCSVLLAAVVCGDEIPTEDNVLVLKESNFKQAMSDHKFILVEFYAPWCGHCKALAPEYSKAATSLKEQDSEIKLAKVDATEETALAEEHQVRGYPTLKFFRSGEAVDYTGGRTSEEIINWLLKKTGPPAAILDTIEAAKTFLESKPVTVIGFFKDRDSAEAKEYIETASALDDHPFAIISDEAIMKEYDAKDGSIVLFKDFDEKRALFEDEFKKENIKKFVTGNSLPLVVDFNHETASKIFSGDIKSHLLIFLSKEAGHYEQHMDTARGVAKTYKGKLLFVTINTDEEDHGRILEFFGMSKEEVPGLRIIKLEEDMAKFKPESYAITEENLKDTIDKFLDGKLKQHLLSQDLPEDWNAHPVKVLVSSNFDEIAFDKDKDVLVEFYAPWCGHCKQLAPIYEQLGEKFQDRNDIVIAKMDATVNELEHTKIQSFPTIKLYKKDDNQQVEYGGSNSLAALTKFVESGGEYGERAPDYEHEEGEHLDEDYAEVVDYSGARTLEALADFVEGKVVEPKEEEEVDEEGDVPAKDEL